MPFLKYVRARIRRGFRLRMLGPNEARILYDAFVAVTSTITAAAFLLVFAGRSVAVPFLMLLPAALLGFNAALGIYSRLKRATGTRKAIVLTSSVSGSCLVALLAGAPADFVVLWAMLAWTPVTFVRLILHLGNSRNRELAAVAVNVRGPVLVIGSHTVDQLLQNGYSVRVLDKLMYGDKSLEEFRSHPQFEFMEGDSTDVRRLTLAMRDASAVIHLAGLVGDPACELLGLRSFRRGSGRAGGPPPGIAVRADEDRQRAGASGVRTR
jgi:hypothetical protein